MKKILIRNGKVVTEDGVLARDLLIENGLISCIGEHLKADDIPEVIDAEGCYVMPGGIDVHVHMSLPVKNSFQSVDDFVSGSKAALAGGTTTIIDFVTPGRDESLSEAFEERKKVASGSCCDYGLHMSITSWSEDTPKMMEECARKYGISSFKVYLAYKDSIGLNDVDLIKVMDVAARNGFLVMAHCEHGDIIHYLQDKFVAAGKTAPLYHAWSRPAVVEAEASMRAIMMAQATGCKLYIVHVSTKEAISAIAAARRRGVPVMGESCPHYLLLDEGRYGASVEDAAGYVMSPPLRPADHKMALWQGLQCGSLQAVATDHCPFNTHGQKEIGFDDFRQIPNGVSGVEERMVLLYTYGVLQGRLSIEQFVNLTSTQPAKMFGLFPRKGVIREGADADLVIWDRSLERKISKDTSHSNCDNNIYEGYTVKGGPTIVIANGRPVYTAGVFDVQAGDGRYLKRTQSEFC